MNPRFTSCRVKIVTPDTPELQESRTYEFETGLDSGDMGDLVGVKVETYLDRMPSTFILSFAYRRVVDVSWARLIPQKSLVMIWLSNGGREGPERSMEQAGMSQESASHDGGEELVMVGLTEPAQDSEKYSAAGLVRTTTVVGRGIESVLEDARVWMAPFLEFHAEKLGKELGNVTIKPYNEILGGRLMWARDIYTKDMTPPDAMLAIYSYYMANSSEALMSVGLPEGYTIAEMLLPGSVSREKLRAAMKKYVRGQFVPLDPLVDCGWTYIGDAIKEKLMFPTGGHNPGGSMSLLSMMHRASDANMHDFFVEYVESDGKPAARLRHRVKSYIMDFSLDDYFNRRSLFTTWGGTRSRATWSDETEESSTLTIRRGPLRPTSPPPPETVTISDDDVISANLTHGTKPVYNLFWAMPGDGHLIRNVVAKAHLPPLFCSKDSPSFIGRFGLKALEYKLPWFTVEMPNKDVKMTGTLVRALQKIQTVLKSWFEPNPLLQSGNITVVGGASLKPGRRLLWLTKDDRGAMEFEISAVSHAYSCADGAFVTTLAVRRGWNVRDAPIASWHGSPLPGTLTEKADIKLGED